MKVNDECGKIIGINRTASSVSNQLYPRMMNDDAPMLYPCGPFRHAISITPCYMHILLQLCPCVRGPPLNLDRIWDPALHNPTPILIPSL